MPELVDLHFAAPHVTTETRADGTLIVRAGQAMPAHARCTGDWLIANAAAKPDHIFFAERTGFTATDMVPGAWRTITYAQALARVRSLGEGLLARKLSAERPVVILSDNSIDHAMLTFACQYIGVPVAPLSQAYSLMSKDFGKLKTIFDLLQPGLVFVQDGAKFASALAALKAHGAQFETVATINVPAGAIALDQLANEPSAAVDAAFAQVTPDTIAKFLFTSGSTGMPKAVINTQRMLTSVIESWSALWPFLHTEPIVLVDWAPWNHTFGGNADVHLVLRFGGSFYIDNGKPAPGMIEHTIANLKDVAPTMFMNVPRGFDMMMPFFTNDADLRRNFFSRLKSIFYAGAALPQPIWERLEQMSIAETGKLVRMLSAWGSTETAPMATAVHWPITKAGVIGNPGPATALKLLPIEEVGGKMKYEVRVRGANITPGYWKQPETTREAFDEDGFYKIGDAVQFANPADHAQGIVFAGRVSEEFKLLTGTFVHTGALRVKGVGALTPLVQDLLVTGHDRDDVGFLLFPNMPALQALAEGLPQDAPPEALFKHSAVITKLRVGLEALRSDGGGSSTYAKRAAFMIEPPNTDAGEITDKGYLNQRAALARRAELVEALYAGSIGITI